MRAVRTILSIALLMTALSGCQNVADILEEVNNLTTSVNEFANGQPISSKSAPMSSGTSASITQSLNRAVPNRGAALQRCQTSHCQLYRPHRLRRIVWPPPAL